MGRPKVGLASQRIGCSALGVKRLQMHRLLCRSALPKEGDEGCLHVSSHPRSRIIDIISDRVWGSCRV
ncbi:hypothetical protein CEP54_007702 [Fusarium duplospermum]|uniref:Uncharacterized protein n=1 Tax=Fusarium duplospermum TaxID=1325734 RepID=A0A428Q043_9HYPO|nr:hypothetical protein CEP54_007702 [Fusarium duplospermum]